MAVPLQDLHDARRDAVGHVPCLFDGRNQMIVFRRKEQRWRADLVQSIAKVESPQKLQTIDVPVAGGMRRQFDELLHVCAMRVRRMQAESREMAYQWHRVPWQDYESGNGEPKSDLRGEIGKRVQNDKGSNPVWVCEREGQRNRGLISRCAVSPDIDGSRRIGG
jgi:hypothetical protein